MGFYQKGKYKNSTQAKKKYRRKIKILKKEYPNASLAKIKQFIKSEFYKQRGIWSGIAEREDLKLDLARLMLFPATRGKLHTKQAIEGYILS